MQPKLDGQAIDAINRILKNGNKAVIQRCKDGIIVMEEVRHIKYRSAERRQQEGQCEPMV